MLYTEEIKDLFSVSHDYHFAHCISADAHMGAGIAVDFKEVFNLHHMKEKARIKPYLIGECILEGKSLNLVTKRNYFDKPTYKTFRVAVEDMKRVALANGIRKIAMPKIGAGLDRLKWEKNKEIIKETFQDTDIEILVCKQS